MPPELLNAVMNWGPLALILFGILYRADQIATALVPVVVEHFHQLAASMKAITIGIESLTSLVDSVANVKEDLRDAAESAAGDHAGIADDTKHIRQGVDELLVHARRHTDREAS